MGDFSLSFSPAGHGHFIMSRLNQGFFARDSMLCVFPAVMALYLLFAPNPGFGLDASWHDEQRLAQLFLFLAFVILVWTTSPRHSLISAVFSLRRALRVCLVCVFVLGAISAALAPMPDQAALEWASFMMLLACTFGLAGVRRVFAERFDYCALVVVVASATVYTAGVAVAYLATFIERMPLHVWELFHGFSNLRFFGHFQSMTLPLLVVPSLLWTLKPYQRIGLFVLSSAWWMLAIASGTRGTWLAMMVAITVGMICGRLGRVWVLKLVVCALSGFAAYFFLFNILPPLFDISVIGLAGSRFSDISSLSGREVLWRAAVDMLKAHPLLGVGPMHFSYFPNGVAAHPHSSVLQWAAEWGTPSALLAIYCVQSSIAAMIVRIRAEAGESRNFLRIALLASIAAAITQSLVDGVIVMPYSQMWLAAIAGWAIGQHLEAEIDYPASRGRPYLEIVTALFLAICGGLIMNAVYPQVLDLKEQQDAFMLGHGGVVQPRFWEQGRLDTKQ